MHSFTVYTAGRIGPQKNPKLFNAIAEKCPDIRFVWIGDGEERKYLTSSNITVTGFVSRDRVIELSVNYDCYLSCSLWEGLPMALLEAMYMEKECIVSNIAGNRDLIENGVKMISWKRFEKYRRQREGMGEKPGAVSRKSTAWRRWKEDTGSFIAQRRTKGKYGYEK